MNVVEERTQERGETLGEKRGEKRDEKKQKFTVVAKMLYKGKPHEKIREISPEKFEDLVESRKKLSRATFDEGVWKESRSLARSKKPRGIQYFRTFS